MSEPYARFQETAHTLRVRHSLGSAIAAPSLGGGYGGPDRNPGGRLRRRGACGSLAPGDEDNQAGAFPRRRLRPRAKRARLRTAPPICSRSAASSARIFWTSTVWESTQRQYTTKARRLRVPDAHTSGHTSWCSTIGCCSRSVPTLARTSWVRYWRTRSSTCCQGPRCTPRNARPSGLVSSCWRVIQEESEHRT